MFKIEFYIQNNGRDLALQNLMLVFSVNSGFHFTSYTRIVLSETIA